MVEINNLSKNKINNKRALALVDFFLKKNKIDGDISIAIVGDKKMKDINREYRGIDKTTDVLSFEGLNEIIINIKQIKRQAKEFKRSFQNEFDFILTHALLHLIGFTDDREEDRLKMIDLGEKFLKDFRI